MERMCFFVWAALLAFIPITGYAQSQAPAPATQENEGEVAKTEETTEEDWWQELGEEESIQEGKETEEVKKSEVTEEIPLPPAVKK